jgi:hypothetical protein
LQLTFTAFLAVVTMLPSYALTQRNCKGRSKDKLRTPPKPRKRTATKRPTSEEEEALGEFHFHRRTSYFTHLPTNRSPRTCKHHPELISYALHCFPPSTAVHAKRFHVLVERVPFQKMMAHKGLYSHIGAIPA